MNLTHSLITALVVSALGTSASAFAQAPQETRPDAPQQSPRQGGGREQRQEEPKTLAELTKDLQKMEGLFTFYKGRKGLSDTIYMEIPEDKLGKLYLLQATASTGTAGTATRVFHGAPLNDIAFHIRTVDTDRVLFMQPNLSNRSLTDPQTAMVIGRSFPENVIASFEVKARSEDKKTVLIDVSDLFRTDPADVTSGLEAAGYALDRNNTYMDSIKVFPENMVVRTVYRMNRRAAGPGAKSFPFAVSYNLSQLPENGYVPRIADTRIGYFTTSFEDISDAASNDQTVNYALRWKLEKKDPNAALSEPKQPIVFYIDNGVPMKYRKAVEEGLLLWNPAFERIGFKNAIVVKQMPDDADWDIADVRYNVVRWTVGMPFAIALFRANPLTGEILNAGINMDAVFASGAANQFDQVFSQTHGTENQEDFAWVPEKYKSRLCTYANESVAEFQYGQEAMSLISEEDNLPFIKEKMVHQYIRDVVSHEMGHILGLRHNFIASTIASGADLSSPDWTAKEGVTGSVMDYMPVNIFALKKNGVSYYTETVGRYDKWAIEYGYMPTGAKTPQEELPTLRQLASRGNERGLAFQTDDMANDWDPYVYTFDMGTEPLEYFEKNIRTSRYLLMTLGERKPKNGESYYEFTRSFNLLSNSYVNNANNAIRYIGGMRVSSNFKGDVAEKPVLMPVDAAKQKRALDLVNTYLFAENAFNFPKEYYSKLTGNPNQDGTQSGARERLFPVFDTFAGAQNRALRSLFQADRLNRIVNNEFRVEDPSKTLRLSDLFRNVSADVWSELSNGHEITPLRRQLQRDHLDILIDMVVDRPAGTPDDALTLAREQLMSIRGLAKKAAPSAKGPYGEAHLNEVVSRIDRALEASTIGVRIQSAPPAGAGRGRP